MMTKVVHLCLASVLLLGVFACTIAPAQTLSVTAKNSGTSVNLAVGGVMTVTLESNITTGYSWSENASISDNTVMIQTGHQYVPPANQIPGAGGNENWTFKALAAGKVTVSMVYMRPFEPNNPPANTFNITVTVK